MSDAPRHHRCIGNHLLVRTEGFIPILNYERPFKFHGGFLMRRPAGNGSRREYGSSYSNFWACTRTTMDEPKCWNTVGPQ